MTEMDPGALVTAEGVQFRAHHFINLLRVEDVGVATIVEQATTYAQEDRGDNTSETVDLTTLREPYNNHMSVEESAAYYTKYAIDLIGDTEAQMAAYRERLMAALNQWQGLPDDASVTLNMKPDAICASCVFGQHCKRTNADVDVDTIWTLGWVSEGLQVADQVEVSGDAADNSLMLVTAAGVIRRMMQLFKDAYPNNPARAFALTRDTTYQPFLQAVRIRGCDYPLYELPKHQINPMGSPGMR